MDGSVLGPKQRYCLGLLYRSFLSVNRVSWAITIKFFLFTMFHLAILVLYRLSLYLVWLRFRRVRVLFALSCIFSAYNSTKCCSLFLLVFWGVRVFVFSGFVLSVGFFTYVDLLGTCVFPNSRYG